MQNNITKFEVSNLTKDSQFLKPVQISFTQNGKDKTWEAVKAHSSVAILLYHTTKDAFLLVKQFRAPVYLHDFKSTFTYELCAGLIDKDKPLVQIAKEEILEECGYKVDTKNISKLTSCVTNVGISGAKQTIYFANIDESMRVTKGGGIEDEEIELFFLPKQKAKEFILNEKNIKTPGLMFALFWYLDTH